jgi:hypothetical protein
VGKILVQASWASQIGLSKWIDGVLRSSHICLPLLLIGRNPVSRLIPRISIVGTRNPEIDRSEPGLECGSPFPTDPPMLLFVLIE